LFTLIAVLVWLRASERISVRVLLRKVVIFRLGMFARRRTDAIPGEIIRLDRRAERDGRKIRGFAIAAGPPDEVDDLTLHDSFPTPQLQQGPRARAISGMQSRVALSFVN
jgi:hypothetical protein